MWEFLQIDVFSQCAGRGNPLAVVLADETLDAARMQAIAAWTNLAETTFLLPPTDPSADYRVRIFTTRQEIAFAGHPSIGSAHAALVTGLASFGDGRLLQECAAGLLPISVERTEGQADAVSVRVPRSRLVRYAAESDSQLDRALDGRVRGESRAALVEGGRRWWLAELQDEDQVRQMQPDHEAIGHLAADTGSLGLCVFARTPGAAQDMVVRAFPQGVGIDEDPASGAANAAIAAYLDEVGLLHSLGSRYFASQGRELGRDAVLELAVDADHQVWVGGGCVTVVRGTLDW